jgi:hypothetical protein
MRSSKIKLDVDFIGGQESLTFSEEKALTEYFQNKSSKMKPRLPSNKNVKILK